MAEDSGPDSGKEETRPWLQQGKNWRSQESILGERPSSVRQRDKGGAHAQFEQTLDSDLRALAVSGLAAEGFRGFVGGS